jgi:DNA-directed RNA polymerase subunit RPC12/RpoP
MKVSRVQIVARGLANRCPNCGGRTLFKPGALFDINPHCPQCGLKIERDEGFFLGSLSLNYGVTLICFLLPVMLLAWHGVIGSTTAFILAGVGAIGIPALLYRSSRSWWLMNYYFFLPQHLPANRETAVADEDENI